MRKKRVAGMNLENDMDTWDRNPKMRVVEVMRELMKKMRQE